MGKRVRERQHYTLGGINDEASDFTSLCSFFAGTGHFERNRDFKPTMTTTCASATMILTGRRDYEEAIKQGLASGCRDEATQHRVPGHDEE